MKKALIIIAAALLLAGCNRYERERVRLSHVEYQGHTYIIAEAYGGLSTYTYRMHVMHDPDCLCHHIENE